MPTKNVVKEFDAPGIYHVYSRASGERLLFRDDADRLVFLTLLENHLSETPHLDESTPEPRKYDVQVAAFCLMGTHFHLVLFQANDPEAITGYMRSTQTSYAMYYNKKYRSKGHVFQSSFRASVIDNDAYLMHIPRYLHLNPRSWENYRWSCYRQYIGKPLPDYDYSWVHPELILTMTPEQYQNFVYDYAIKDLRDIKSELSDFLAH